MAKRVRGDRKMGKRGKMAVATDPLFQLLAVRMSDSNGEIMRLLQQMTREQRIVIAAGALVYQHAFAQISGACLIIDRGHDVYDRTMKHKPKVEQPMPRQRGKGRFAKKKR